MGNRDNIPAGYKDSAVGIIPQEWEAEIDIQAVQQEVDALETELAEVQTKMKAYLKELGM